MENCWPKLPRKTTCEYRTPKNIITYRADYFGRKLHMDQNEKLEMYGVVDLEAIEGQECPGKRIKSTVLFYSCFVY